jgi:hypothetical protein
MTLVTLPAVRPVGPVRAVEVGYGMCRGKGWTFDEWPVVMGRQVRNHQNNLMSFLCCETAGFS